MDYRERSVASTLAVGPLNCMSKGCKYLVELVLSAEVGERILSLVGESKDRTGNIALYIKGLTKFQAL